MNADHRTEFAVPLSEPIDGEHVEELRRRVYFVDPAIVDFRLEPSTGPVRTVVLVTTGPADGAELTRRLHAMLATDVRTQLITAPKVLWTSPHQRPIAPDPFAELAELGLASEVGVGRVTLGQPAIALLDVLDGLLRDIAVSGFGATEYRYPTLIDVATLQRSGYLSAFPQYLMFVTRPRGDLDTYGSVSAEARSGADVGGSLLGHCDRVDLALPPTMCYHTFHQLSGTTMDAATAVVTARGPSFRHESRYHRNLERLADFTIRETVFLGSADFVRAARDGFRLAAIDLVDGLGLAGRCEVASDPFFTNAADRVSSQRFLELKHELHLNVAPDRSVSVGSFNLHDRHFGGAFDIRTPGGEPASTSCVGFGLERLAYAFLCQHGSDPRSWPELIRERLAPPLTNRLGD